MLTFDASSIIHGWDNYPIEQFPGLWAWVGDQVSQAVFILLEVAYDEVERNEPECAAWLKDHGLTRAPVSADILAASLRIKDLLGIVEDQYHQKGVGENDLLIIAHAMIEQIPLVTNEAVQNMLPQNRQTFKIPAVCDLPDVRVRHLNFVGVIKESRQVF